MTLKMIKPRMAIGRMMNATNIPSNSAHCPRDRSPGWNRVAITVLLGYREQAPNGGVDRATALPSQLCRITLDAKHASRGSGPTICSAELFWPFNIRWNRRDLRNIRDNEPVTVVNVAATWHSRFDRSLRAIGVGNLFESGNEHYVSPKVSTLKTSAAQAVDTIHQFAPRGTIEVSTNVFHVGVTRRVVERCLVIAN
jgi:hypothetical protein